MALTPNSDESFLREVDEAVRQDQLLGIWQRYGRLISGGVIGALALFGGYLLWQNHKQQQSGEVAESAQKVLMAAARNSTPEGKALATISDARQPGYRAIAQMVKAGAALQKGDSKGASAIFATMAGDETLAKPYRDLALIRQTALNFDQMSPQQVVDRLKPLAVPGEPWFGTAGEMTAIAYMKMGKPGLAGSLFSAISKDKLVPQSVRSRAGQMAAVLGIETGSDGAGA